MRLVRLTRLELVLLAEHAPQTCVYANSTTTAYFFYSNRNINSSDAYIIHIRPVYVKCICEKFIKYFSAVRIVFFKH